MIHLSTVADLSSIQNIIDILSLDVTKSNDIQYKVNAQKNGFVIPYKLPLEEFENKENKFFIHEESGVIDGFIWVEEKQEIGQEDYVDWFKPELKENYFSKEHRCLGKMGVLPDKWGKGIGTELLDIVIQNIDVPYLYSFVVLSPISNMASMLFHEKNGFERVAISVSKHLFGMENYRSILYAKKLE